MIFCVLIPAYNSFTGLVNSVKSIVFNPKDFLVVVVDDGSDEIIVAEEINKLLCNAMNIKVVRLEKNLGITAALNRGLEYIYAETKVRFIARLDCGDICRADRFEKQVKFLDENQHVDLVGSWCYFQEPGNRNLYKYTTPIAQKEVVRSMYFRNVFIHPTVMWRISGVGRVYYLHNFPCAEDYAFFYEIIKNKASFIIPEYLVTCETNNSGISITRRNLQLKSRLKVITHYNKANLFLLLGTIKLYLLLLTPYNLIYFIKRIIFKAAIKPVQAS